MGKGYHVYIKNESLVEVFDMINQERGELSAVMSELALNGMDKVVERHLKKKNEALKRLKKANKSMKKAKALGKKQEEEIYLMYCNRIKNSPFVLDRKSNLYWIEPHATKLGKLPAVLLDEFEKKYKKVKK